MHFAPQGYRNLQKHSDIGSFTDKAEPLETQSAWDQLILPADAYLAQDGNGYMFSKSALMGALFICTSVRYTS